MEAAIVLRGLTKRFADSRQPQGFATAVEAVDLDVGAQEFLTMVGPSGCGKSTILRLIAGLEEPTAGDVFIDGQRVNDVSPKDRGIGFMFQGYALFSHMTVAENIEFGLKVRKMPPRQRRERVADLVSLVGLEGLESRKPSQLSGGQQQRVALARALAPQPRLLLLDEPFGALDAKVRQRLRVDTKKLQRELKIPTILVTHDQREALELGDRVAVMSHGRFEQIAIPAEVYDNPQSEFVARFIGRTNIFQTELEEDHILFTKGTRLDVMVRPEEILVSALPEPLTEMPTMVGTITEYSFLGRSVRLEVTLTNGTICTVALPNSEALKENLALGSRVSLEITACHAFLQRDGAYTENGSGNQEAISRRDGETARGTSKSLPVGQG